MHSVFKLCKLCIYFPACTKFTRTKQWCIFKTKCIAAICAEKFEPILIYEEKTHIIFSCFNVSGIEGFFTLIFSSCSPCAQAQSTINWEDKLVSAEVINISRVIKLSLSSHDILPPRDLSCSFFFLWRAQEKELGAYCTSEQALSLWCAVFFKLSWPLDSS